GNRCLDAGTVARTTSRPDKPQTFLRASVHPLNKIGRTGRGVQESLPRARELALRTSHFQAAGSIDQANPRPAMVCPRKKHQLRTPSAARPPALSPGSRSKGECDGIPSVFPPNLISSPPPKTNAVTVVTVR
ncbi:hypothetical protein CTA1_12533, partial [Colletotrichum tanaceti]